MDEEVVAKKILRAGPRLRIFDEHRSQHGRPNVAIQTADRRVEQFYPSHLELATEIEHLIPDLACVSTAAKLVFLSLCNVS